MQLPTPECSHLPVSHCRAPLSPPGPLLLGPSLCSFLPSPAANTCSGSGRTAESGHLRAGSRVPAARLPGGGARGCCPRRRRRRRRRRRGGADEVAMVMELRSCPLSAQQLPGRGLLWAAPAKRAGWQGCQHGERDSPPPLRKGEDRVPAPAPLSSRPLAPLTSAPLLVSFPRRDAAGARRTAHGAQRALAACRTLPAAAGWPGAPQPCAAPRGCASGWEARRPLPQPQPSPRRVGGGGGSPGAKPRPLARPACGGASSPTRRPPGLAASPGREHAQSPRRGGPPELEDGDAGEIKRSSPDLTPREGRQMTGDEGGRWR